jgi:hypothetical protein
MANFQSIKSHFDTNNLSYYSFYPKYKTLTKTVVRHLPHITPAENISDGMVSIKQMTASHQSPPEG